MGNVLSIPIGHLPGGNKRQDVVMDYFRLRQKRVLALIHERHGEGRGAFVAFAEEFEIAPSQVSRWFMSGENRRNIGEDMARRIEDKYKLGRGYLVMPEAETVAPSNVAPMLKPWPFPTPREKYDLLSDRQQGAIEEHIRSEAEKLEEAVKANPKRKKLLR